eukprot:scaffold30457_cov73-Isochrysis_galbana.AAC.2
MVLITISTRARWPRAHRCTHSAARLSVATAGQPSRRIARRSCSGLDVKWRFHSCPRRELCPRLRM